MKKTIQGWLKMGAAWALLGLAAAGASPGAAHAQEEKREGFYNVEELKRLLEVARESGFTEKELREITVEDGDKVINVWDFLKEYERKKRERAARLKAQKEKVYLTVQDVVEDLEKEQPKDLSRLRDKIPTN